MAAVKEVELIVPQGSTFVYEMEYVDPDDDNAPVNLTGYTARMHLREKLADTDTIYEADTDGDIVITSPVNGVLVLTIPAAVTAAWTFKKAVFDVEIVLGPLDGAGAVTRIVKGVMLLDREVTR